MAAPKAQPVPQDIINRVLANHPELLPALRAKMHPEEVVAPGYVRYGQDAMSIKDGGVAYRGESPEQQHQKALKLALERLSKQSR